MKNIDPKKSNKKEIVKKINEIVDWINDFDNRCKAAEKILDRVKISEHQ